MIKKKATGTPKTKVAIHKMSDARLIDERAVPKRAGAVSTTILTAVILGLLLGGMALGYFLYFYSPVEESYNTRIIVPNFSGETASSTPQSTASKEPEVIRLQVTIADTPTGSLNVRKGPGTNFEKVGQVKPGETYELVSEDKAKGWYEIRVSDSLTGWVSGQYASVK